MTDTMVHQTSISLENYNTEDLSASDWDRLRANLFGELFALAAPVVKNYHSDLYRDAQQIQIEGWLTGHGQELIYYVRENGTHLFRSEDDPERYPFDDDVHRYIIAIMNDTASRFRLNITTTKDHQ